MFMENLWIIITSTLLAHLNHIKQKQYHKLNNITYTNPNKRKHLDIWIYRSHIQRKDWSLRRVLRLSWISRCNERHGDLLWCIYWAQMLEHETVWWDVDNVRRWAPISPHPKTRWYQSMVPNHTQHPSAYMYGHDRDKLVADEPITY